MEFEEFSTRLSAAKSKHEEQELFRAQWKDPRINTYIASMTTHKFNIPIQAVMDTLNGPNPEWVIPMVENDIEEKSIELQNTFYKIASGTLAMQKLIGVAMLERFNDKYSYLGNQEYLMDEFLECEKDCTMQYLAICRIRDRKCVDDMITYDKFIQTAQVSKNRPIAQVAVEIMEQNRKCEEEKLDEHMIPRVTKPVEETPTVHIVRIEYTPFIGDWIPIDHIHEPGQESESDKRSTPSGISR